MKLHNISFALLLGLGALTSCDSKLDVENPNEQTTSTFGIAELEENVIAAYNHIRMEGSTLSTSHVVMKCGTHLRFGTRSSTTTTVL